jgi:glycine cleavage system H protein
MSKQAALPDRKYTKEHEWARLEGDVLWIGITAFAVDQLGDVTLVNFDVNAGDKLEAGKAFGTIESVKTLSDLFAPISGEVIELNKALEDQPELVNEDCWGKGWMLKVRCKDASALGALMDHGAYERLTEDGGH